MSEYTIVQVHIKDSVALKEALKEMGYVYEEHQTAQPLYGYENKMRAQKANIIIRKEHVGSAANDVGFLKNANGEYEMIISQYDRWAGKQSEDFMKRLPQVYSTQTVIRKAKAMGYTVMSKRSVDGDIKIKVM